MLITDRDRFNIAYSLQNCESVPKGDIERFLKAFCDASQHGHRIHEHFVETIAILLSRYLSRKATTLDAAFGLKSSRRGRKAQAEKDPRRDPVVVARYLDYRLQGKARGEAIKLAGESVKPHLGTKSFEKFWSNKIDRAFGWELLLRERSDTKQAWSLSDRERLTQIFRRDPEMLRRVTRDIELLKK